MSKKEIKLVAVGKSKKENRFFNQKITFSPEIFSPKRIN